MDSIGRGVKVDIGLVASADAALRQGGGRLNSDTIRQRAIDGDVAAGAGDGRVVAGTAFVSTITASRTQYSPLGIVRNKVARYSRKEERNACVRDIDTSPTVVHKVRGFERLSSHPKRTMSHRRTTKPRSYRAKSHCIQPHHRSNSSKLRSTTVALHRRTNQRIPSGAYKHSQNDKLS